LMTAGRRIVEIRNFWTNELERRRFWEVTSGKEFTQEGDTLFEEVVSHPFHDLAASGESAYFWRRVFYDIRKIHQLVWQNDFPRVLLELAHSPNGTALLNFLRSGQLPGQRPWVGVFGQSAGAPLFFIVRELRRLKVIENEALDPLAFFTCTPVRRAAVSIGWIDSALAGNTDFQSLAAMSEKLHAKLSGDQQFGLQLLPFFDIPLLHMGLTD